jgi:TRAP-type C4-dicarboxylate transport system substrate-binding protein
VDANNIQRPSFEQLSAEDRQAYEAYMKECEEENIRQKEKEDEEASRWFLSHFSIDRKSAVSKDKYGRS